jgi:hypothetical protein
MQRNINHKEHKERKDQLLNTWLASSSGINSFSVFYAFFVVNILNPRKSAKSVAKNLFSTLFLLTHKLENLTSSLEAGS